ncbi:hypothetical protein AWH63_10580 [Marinobacter sp. C18]|nr:hypothetical protein AWH63_10580 [Marinobacter sp. C18]
MRAGNQARSVPVQCENDVQAFKDACVTCLAAGHDRNAVLTALLEGQFGEGRAVLVLELSARRKKLERIDVLIERHVPVTEASNAVPASLRAHNIDHAEKVQSALLMIAQHEQRDDVWVWDALLNLSLESAVTIATHPVIPTPLKRDILGDLGQLPGFDARASGADQPNETRRLYGFSTAMIRVALNKETA